MASWTAVTLTLLSVACMASAMTIQLEGLEKYDDSILRVILEKKSEQPKPEAKALEAVQPVHQIVPVDVINSSCDTNQNSVQCCFAVDVPQCKLNDKGCLNITYIQKDLGVNATVTFNGEVLFTEELSARNPPPICAGFPHLPDLAGACLRLTNLDFKDKQFTGCADFEIWHNNVMVKKYDLGCFKIPPSS